MDFFEHQADATRRTRLLVFYYGLAVAAIIGAIYLVVVLGLLYGQSDAVPKPVRFTLWHPEVFLFTTLGVGAVIAAGTLFKITSLAGGGKSVARMMGGTPISAETTDLAERRLLNIVEEMAIAAGVPVPPVYVMEEEGINAFAAGFKPSDAVIGVTRGCLETLDRDELQGVIAHEFSHIVNGDMRLNIRLIGVLFGILLITVIGQVCMRIGLYSGMGRRRSARGKGENGLPIALMVFGILLIIIGAIGVFFGRLIKSAVSRQREFLADASAVQFTRNPDGIAGALKKIGGYTSKVKSVHAEEASHMFFANSLKSSLGGLLATHPPLQERIRRIDSAFAQGPGTEGGGASTAGGSLRRDSTPDGISGLAESAPVNSPEDITATVGSLDASNLDYAATMIQSIPASLRETLHTPAGARAALYCLLLADEDEETLDQQLKWLHENLQEPTGSMVEKLNPEIRKLPTRARMPMVDLALPALQQQEKDEFELFKQTIDRLITADNKIGIFEFALSRTLIRNLEPVFGKPQKVAVAYYGIRLLRPHCLPLLALLARFGNEDNPEQAAADFAAGVSQLDGQPETTPMPEIEADPVQTFAQALDVLRQADNKIKKQILNSCVAAVTGNGKVTVEEGELLRAVADSLECPLPPIDVRPYKMI